MSQAGGGGSIRALTDGFVAAFGDAVAADHPEKAQIVHFGDTVTLAVPATLDGEGRPQTRVIAPKHCLHCGRCAEICPSARLKVGFKQREKHLFLRAKGADAFLMDEFTVLRYVCAQNTFQS